MEPSSRTGLHPLLTIAAVSVTVFSAVGIGALTGVLPHSFGSTQEAAPAQISSAEPQPVAAPAPVAAAETPMPPAAAASTPEPVRKPVHKAVKHHVVAQASEPAPAAAQYAPPPPPPAAQPPQPQVVAEARAPAPAGVLGVVESVREIKTPAKESNGVGPIAGGIVGALLGNQFGHGNGRSVMTVAGAAAGALGGRAIEEQARATKHWEVTVRLDDGTLRTLKSSSEPFWHGGERVRFLDGKLTPA